MERTLTILAANAILSSMLSLETAQPIIVDGTALATSVKGEGASLVFVHGGVSDLRTWSNQFDTFAESYRTIAYSRRYSRPNEPIPIDASDPIQQHVDDLAGLIDALDAGPAHIVGHSWGALIALLATKQTPEICRSLVLIEPPVVSMHVNMPPKASQMIGLLLTAPRLAVAIARLGGGALGPAEKAFRRGDDKQAIELFGRGVLGKRYFEALSDERYTQVWENRGPDRAQALHHGFPNLIGETFTEVSVPVMLISGADSPRIFDLLSDSLLDRLSNARKRVIADASHMVQEDAPETLNAAILEFLDVVD
jgi:pimeloyl-ACP methyl ester carboxylesterase